MTKLLRLKLQVVKGGLVVDVGQRGFVPASLISTDFIEDFSVFDGQTIRIKVEELDPENNRVILSRKAVEQAENDVKKASLLESLNAGDVIKGKVARLTNFGAFVDIGGVDGLVHVSELSHEHVDSPEDVVSVGQEVDVKVKSVEKMLNVFHFLSKILTYHLKALKDNFMKMMLLKVKLCV